ncbi:MAG: hypothetical protein BEN19_03410 [Epulopiscium sp. Nuni2H_MBin003]|nr:MAG: hypothetical protein BEN19_03410 [Epulopiscium sp. Nuni2H_MBin003]
MEQEQLIQLITQQVIKLLNQDKIPVGISARHVHLSDKDARTLFGENYQFTKLKDLSQPGQFATNEFVDLIGKKGTIKKVRILGPTRPETQVEISVSDTRKLGIKAVPRMSGDILNTPGVIIRGPKAEITIPNGVIVAARHLHASIEDAKRLNLADKDKIRVHIPGDRGGILDGVIVRVHKDYALDLHIDVDDANAFLVNQGDWLEFEKAGSVE